MGFKIQVHDWKNLLLRGQDAANFPTHSKRFAGQDRLVQNALTAVQDSPALPAELQAEAASLGADHAELLPKYQAAAAAYSSTDSMTIFSVDRSVRGIDQKLDGRIDSLAQSLVEREALYLEEGRVAGEKLYNQLRIAMAGGGRHWLASRSDRRPQRVDETHSPDEVANLDQRSSLFYATLLFERMVWIVRQLAISLQREE